jgi:hypothetical protein
VAGAGRSCDDRATALTVSGVTTILGLDTFSLRRHQVAKSAPRCFSDLWA